MNAGVTNRSVPRRYLSVMGKPVNRAVSSDRRRRPPEQVARYRKRCQDPAVHQLIPGGPRRRPEVKSRRQRHRDHGGSPAGGANYVLPQRD